MQECEGETVSLTRSQTAGFCQKKSIKKLTSKNTAEVLMIPIRPQANFKQVCLTQDVIVLNCNQISMDRAWNNVQGTFFNNNILLTVIKN